MTASHLQPGLVAKAIASAVGAGLSAAIAALQDGNIESWEWAGVVGAVLVSGGLVWLVKNGPEGIRAYSKMIVSLLTVAAGVIGTALLDGQGITLNEALSGLLALVTAFTVANTPNAAESDERTLAYPYDGDEAGPAHFAV